MAARASAGLRDPVTSLPIVHEAALCALYGCTAHELHRSLLPPLHTARHAWHGFPDEEVDNYLSLLSLWSAADGPSALPRAGEAERAAGNGEGVEERVPVVLYAAVITRHTMLSHVSEQMLGQPVPVSAKLSGLPRSAHGVAPHSASTRSSAGNTHRSHDANRADAHKPHAQDSPAPATATATAAATAAPTAPSPQPSRWKRQSANGQSARLLLSRTHIYILPDTERDAAAGDAGGRPAPPTHPPKRALAIPLSAVVKLTCFTHDSDDDDAGENGSAEAGAARVGLPTRLNMIWVRLPGAPAGERGVARDGRVAAGGAEACPRFGYFAFCLRKDVAGDGSHSGHSSSATTGVMDQDQLFVDMLTTLAFLPEWKAATTQLPTPLSLSPGDPYRKWRSLFEDTRQAQSRLAAALENRQRLFSEVVHLAEETGTLRSGSSNGDAKAAPPAREPSTRPRVLVAHLENVSAVYRRSLDLNAPATAAQAPASASPSPPLKDTITAATASDANSAGATGASFFRSVPPLAWVPRTDAVTMGRLHEALLRAATAAATEDGSDRMRRGSPQRRGVDGGRGGSLPTPTRQRLFAPRLPHAAEMAQRGAPTEEERGLWALVRGDERVLHAVGPSSPSPRNGPSPELPPGPTGSDAHDEEGGVAYTPSRSSRIRSIRRVRQ